MNRRIVHLNLVNCKIKLMAWKRFYVGVLLEQKFAVPCMWLIFNIWLTRFLFLFFYERCWNNDFLFMHLQISVGCFLNVDLAWFWPDLDIQPLKFDYRLVRHVVVFRFPKSSLINRSAWRTDDVRSTAKQKSAAEAVSGGLIPLSIVFASQDRVP